MVRLCNNTRRELTAAADLRYQDWSNATTDVLLHGIFGEVQHCSCKLTVDWTGIAEPQRWQYIHWGFIVTFLILLPITTFLNMFQCLPVPADYSLCYVGAIVDPAITISCLNRVSIGYATRILHILTDVTLLCLPITIVMRLHMPRSKIYRLVAVFAVDGMSTIASILRNVFTYDGYIIWCFDNIDITFAVIVICLPALNGLLESTKHRMSSLRSLVYSKSFGSGSASQSRTRWKHPQNTASETHLAGRNGSQEAADEYTSSRPWQKTSYATEQPVELTGYAADSNW